MTDPSKSKFNLLLAEDEKNCQLDKHQQKIHTEWFECKVRPLPLAEASDQGVIHPPSRRRGPGDKLCTFNLRSVNTHQWDPTRGVEHRVEEKIPPPRFRKRSWKWLRFLRAEQKKSPGEKFQEPQSRRWNNLPVGFFSNFLTRKRLNALGWVAEWSTFQCGPVELGSNPRLVERFYLLKSKGRKYQGYWYGVVAMLKMPSLSST